MNPVGQLAGTGWRIIWFRVGDRLAHRVEVLDGDRTYELLTSVEGTSDDDWPASPPLQEMHFEDRPGGSRVALLVGMAGKSHWSASVEMNAAGDRATFELACRAKVQPEWLGTTYTMAGDGAQDERGWQLGPLRLTPNDALVGTPSAATGQIMIAARCPSNTWPQTICWSYSIELAARENG